MFRSFWSHVLATAGPWWFWTINYTHFSLEALRAVLGVVTSSSCRTRLKVPRTHDRREH